MCRSCRMDFWPKCKHLQTHNRDMRGGEKVEIFRQGDILLIKREEVPDGFKKSSDKILIRGETTGHAHKASRTVQVFRNPEGRMFISGSGQLLHEEHDPIPIDGIYEIQRQIEY